MSRLESCTWVHRSSGGEVGQLYQHYLAGTAAIGRGRDGRQQQEPLVVVAILIRGVAPAIYPVYVVGYIAAYEGRVGDLELATGYVLAVRDGGAQPFLIRVLDAVGSLQRRYGRRAVNPIVVPLYLIVGLRQQVVGAGRVGLSMTAISYSALSRAATRS